MKTRAAVACKAGASLTTKTTGLQGAGKGTCGRAGFLERGQSNRNVVVQG